MSDTVIKIEGLGKKYKLGSIGTGSLKDDLNRWWAKYKGKDDPYIKIGDHNSRIEMKDFWALKDLNLEIKKGEAVGIIGKNGAGKSTLLKIISRITTPTEGQVKIKGRFASLLEVGTGFHPDLTGRENIFLNGAIMGMTKKEIKSKLNAIIDFSGIEQFIDTPVKRYSSGMYVRLAFAVAAHLDSDILIIDEVLAVGDAEFQKKCMGKINEVTSDGRTILFVSHNIGAVQTLCKRGIFLSEGKIIKDSSTEEAISAYSNYAFNNYNAERTWNIMEAPGTNQACILAVRLLNNNKKISNIFLDNEEVYIEIDYKNKVNGSYLTSNIQLYNTQEIIVLSSGNWASATINLDPYSSVPLSTGLYRSRVKIPAYFLNEGNYYINALILQNSSNIIVNVKQAVTFTIVDSGDMRKEYTDNFAGVVRPKLEWNTNIISSSIFQTIYD